MYGVVVHLQVAVEERAGAPQMRTAGLNGERLASSWRALGRNSDSNSGGGGGRGGLGGDWGEAEAYALLVHADQVSHVVTHCEGVGQWRLAAALGSRVALSKGNIGKGLVTEAQADACVVACEGTLRRALSAALAASPLRFDSVAEVAATAEETVGATAAPRSEITRSALAQLALCAKALCKAAPLQPTLPLDVAADVVAGHTDKAAAAAAIQRAVADGLRQCFAAVIRVALTHLPPSGEPALLQLRWEDTNDGGVEEDESAETAFETLSDCEAASLALQRIVRLGWTMHCRAMLLAAWERHAAAEEERPASGAAAAAAAEAVQTWACQLLAAERSRPPMEVYSVVLALFSKIPNPSVARVHQVTFYHSTPSPPQAWLQTKSLPRQSPVCARSGANTLMIHIGSGGRLRPSPIY